MTTQTVTEGELLTRIEQAIDKQFQSLNKPGTITLKQPDWLAHLSQWAQANEKPSDKNILELAQDGKMRWLSSADVQRESIMAEMRRGFLAPVEEPVNRFVKGIPLGSMAVGTIVGLITGELVDGFVSQTKVDEKTGKTVVNMNNIITKVVAGAAIWFASKWVMTPMAALFAIGILVAEILADLLPIDQWAHSILGIFKKETRGTEPVRHLHQDGRVLNLEDLAQAPMRQEPPILVGSRDVFAGVFGG